MNSIEVVILAYVLLGVLEWYYVYPNKGKLPHPVFLLLWPFLTLAAIVKLALEKDEKEKE